MQPPPDRGRVLREGDRARAAPDPAKGRHGRLAQDLRQIVLRPVSRAGEDRRGRRSGRVAMAVALRFQGRLDRRPCQAALFRRTRHLTSSRHTNAQFMDDAFDARAYPGNAGAGFPRISRSEDKPAGAGVGEPVRKVCGMIELHSLSAKGLIAAGCLLFLISLAVALGSSAELAYADTIKNPIAVFAALDKVTGRISH